MDFKLPVLGENIKAGDVVNVLVKVGDSVVANQSVIEMETDKAVVELPIPFSGKITKVLVKNGDKVKVGQVLMQLDGVSEVAPAEAPKAALPKVEEPVKKAVPQAVPQKAAPVIEKKAAAKPAPPTVSKSADEILAGPQVRKMARELSIDLGQVAGSGSGGRITVEDLQGFSESQTFSIEGDAEEVSSAVSENKITIPLPDFSKWGEVDIQPMSSIRGATARNLSFSWTQIPQVTQNDEADITEISELRKRFSKKVEASGGKLTMTAILLKICGSALKVFPQFNASVDMDGEKIIFKKYCNIGVAVDTDKGLVVPVIRDVDKKNILELSIDLTKASEKAKSRKISLDEMQGGSFTITNLGSIGGGHFSPIVRWPEVAILGVGRGEIKPKWINDKWEPRLMLPLSLTYDHRLIDGADAARFLRWLAEAVQEPFLMELEG